MHSLYCPHIIPLVCTITYVNITYIFSVQVICIHWYMCYLHRLQHLLGFTKEDLVDRNGMELHHHHDVAGCRKVHISCKHSTRSALVITLVWVALIFMHIFCGELSPLTICLVHSFSLQASVSIIKVVKH